MKTKMLVARSSSFRFWNLIARFGEARLVTLGDGRVELHGGSTSDHREAREWISLFMHEAVPQAVASPRSNRHRAA